MSSCSTRTRYAFFKWTPQQTCLDGHRIASDVGLQTSKKYIFIEMTHKWPGVVQACWHNVPVMFETSMKTYFWKSKLRVANRSYICPAKRVGCVYHISCTISNCRWEPLKSGNLADWLQHEQCSSQWLVSCRGIHFSLIVAIPVGHGMFLWSCGGVASSLIVAIAEEQEILSWPSYSQSVRFIDVIVFD